MSGFKIILRFVRWLCDLCVGLLWTGYNIKHDFIEMTYICISESCLPFTKTQKDCADYCVAKQLGGLLSLSYQICAFQNFCDCFKCPIFEENVCEENCNKTDRVIVQGAKNYTGCKMCECQCSALNCTSMCSGNTHKLILNEYNCAKCDCDCPRLDCDEPCGGIGLGVHGPKDESGCYTTCDGCIDDIGLQNFNHLFFAWQSFEQLDRFVNL